MTIRGCRYLTRLFRSLSCVALGLWADWRSGWIERSGAVGIHVHTGFDRTVNNYISGDNLRSWCVLGSDGEPLPGWCEIAAEDHSKISQE